MLKNKCFFNQYKINLKNVNISTRNVKYLLLCFYMDVRASLIRSVFM